MGIYVVGGGEEVAEDVGKGEQVAVGQRLQAEGDGGV